MNGFKNYDTWLVCTWLDNTYALYKAITENKNIFLNMSKTELLNYMKSRGCSDKISSREVDLYEVRQFIREM